MDRGEVLRLYDAWADDVYRLAYSFLLNPADAQDAVQEVFLRLLQKNCTPLPGRERALLARITANYCKDCLRRARRRPDPAEQEPAAPDTTPGRLELRAALQALSPGYRAVVHLYYYAGYTPQEIAAALGLTRSGVYMRLTRARRLLGDFLKEGSP